MEVYKELFGNMAEALIKQSMPPSVRRVPQQKPGSSKQDYQTPKEFLDAVKARLNIHNFALDVAASAENAVCDHFYTEDMDAFKQVTWNRGGWSWCNPPYGDIRPWVARISTETYDHGTHLAMLVPASSGANWWRDHVEGKAYVTYLNGRIKFVGAKDMYPKDLALLLYAPFLSGGSCIWTWKSTTANRAEPYGGRS